MDLGQELEVAAVAPTADGRPAERFLLRDGRGQEIVLDRAARILHPPMPAGTSRLHGYWRRPTDSDLEGFDLRREIERASVPDEIAVVDQGEDRWAPSSSGIGGAVWTRTDHPAVLDADKSTTMDVFRELRRERDGLPLTVLVHGRECDDPLPFTSTVQHSNLLHTTDDVWVMPSPKASVANVDVGAVYLTIDADDPQGQQLYHHGYIDIVVLTGDEAPASMPADLFSGRASVVVIEAVGPHSHQLLERYRRTDTLVFLSYPWPPRSIAARTLWQAFMPGRDPSSLALCLEHIAGQLRDKEHEFTNVARTLAVALHDDAAARKELLERFDDLVDDARRDVVSQRKNTEGVASSSKTRLKELSQAADTIAEIFRSVA